MDQLAETILDVTIKMIVGASAFAWDFFSHAIWPAAAPALTAVVFFLSVVTAIEILFSPDSDATKLSQAISGVLGIGVAAIHLTVEIPEILETGFFDVYRLLLIPLVVFVFLAALFLLKWFVNRN